MAWTSVTSTRAMLAEVSDAKFLTASRAIARIAPERRCMQELLRHRTVDFASNVQSITISVASDHALRIAMHSSMHSGPYVHFTSTLVLFALGPVFVCLLWQRPLATACQDVQPLFGQAICHHGH